MFFISRLKPKLVRKHSYSYSFRISNCIALIGCLVVSLVANVGHAAGQTITNDQFWKTVDNETIYSQGGGILQVGDTYYWYGIKYNGAVTYAANPTKPNKDWGFNAVTIYSSKDLANWTFEGNALEAATSGPEIAQAGWIGRMGVSYNANTNKYVLVSQYWSEAHGAQILFATSDSPTGTFTFEHLQEWVPNVVTSATGDQTVFTDDDGQAYLIFSNRNGRQNLYVAPLRATDFLQVEPATRIYFSASGGREGNAMFKYNGLYYFCSSDLHGWNASHTYCITASNILGPYSEEFVMGGTDADFSHVTQTGFFIPVNGSEKTTILYAGDRWSDFAGNGLGYNQWMPLSFNGTMPTLNSVSEFELDVATGNWSVGAGNNYILNPSLEADRISQTKLAGWYTWSATPDATPFGNVKGGHTGQWSMNFWDDKDYAGSMYQYIDLPNGTYTLKAWVLSGGGQAYAQVYIKNFGNPELNYPINNPISGWTEISIPNIQVTNGRAEVGVYTVASGGQWLRVDDLSLVKQ